MTLHLDDLDLDSPQRICQQLSFFSRRSGRHPCSRNRREQSKRGRGPTCLSPPRMPKRKLPQNGEQSEEDSEVVSDTFTSVCSSLISGET